MRVKPTRSQIVFIHDLLMAAISFPLAQVLRLGDMLPGYFAPGFLPWATLGFTLTAAVFFRLQGMYRGVWRYASLNDLISILKAVTLAILSFAVILFLINRLEGFPRSALLINWFVLVMLLGGPRFLYRKLKDRRVARKADREGRRIPVLLVGADDPAALFIRSVERDPGAPYRVVGILSHKPGRVGRKIRDVEVMGTLETLPAAVDALSRRGHAPQKVVIAEEKLSPASVSELMEKTEALGLSLSRLPRLNALEAGDSSVSVRPIALEDLLQRPQTRLDREAMARLIAGGRVLITGAGVSIGRELVRQNGAFSPALLSLLELSEFNLYTIDHEIARTYSDLSRSPLLADIRNRNRVDRIMAAEKPALVFHAAALKHVPMTEVNPLEGILTNTVGTRVLADACRAHDVGAMVMVSTDKAVNPTNVMGATKRLAEAYCQALDVAETEEKAHSALTRFVTVRFGNVLGSTGSVVPLFQKQLAAGGPLTVTHPDVRRYFMTVREAVELVLQASALGSRKGGESADLRTELHGRIFVLEMGEPVKIVELARQVIRLAGLKPDEDIRIEFTGLRPGEKLFEEVFHGAEAPVPTEVEGLLLAEPRITDAEDLAGELDALETLARAGKREDALRRLADLVPEYTPWKKENS